MTPPKLYEVRRELARRSLAEFTRQAWPIVEGERPLVWGWPLDAICEHLEAVTHGDIRDLILNVPPKHSKPVDIDSIVLMGDGSRKRLGDIRVGDSVVSHLGRPQQVLGVYDQGALSCLKIETFCGREVVAAKKHPFLTPEGWVAAGDLREGQCLASVVCQNLPASSDVARDEEFSLAGYFVGDGSVSAKGKTGFNANITSGDVEYADHIVQCCRILGFTAKVVSYKKIHLKRINVSGGVRPWLDSIGLARKTSYTKRVPEFVFRGDLQKISLFLAAYFHCDGTVSKRAPGRNTFVISFSSVSGGLLRDVQHLLLRFGIRSRFRSRFNKNHRFGSNVEGGGYLYYALDIGMEDDAARFLSCIPLRGRKLEKLRDYRPLMKEFRGVHIPDGIIGIYDIGNRHCVCLSVREDHSFLVSDIAVSNSTLVSVMWPSWEWIDHPERRWMFTSYAGSLSRRDSLKCRRIIMSEWYQRNWGPESDWPKSYELLKEQNSGFRYDNSHTGYRMATTCMGQGTGHGGDRIVIDDPHNTLKAESETDRNARIDWWQSVMSTRKDDKFAGRVIIMQRCHENDLTGYILDNETGWEHLRLPARYESDAPCTTSIGFCDPRSRDGELLLPERFDEEEVRRLEHALGGYAAAAQLQQRPSPRRGGIFEEDRWQYYIHPPNEFDFVVDSWDMAFKDLKTSSYVCGQKWGFRGVDGFLLALARGQWDIVRTCEQVILFSLRDPVAPRKYVEDKANGPAIIQLLRSKITGLIEFHPEDSKVGRANAIAPLQEAGNLHIPQNAPWTREFIRECSLFPNGRYSDQVDAMSQALLAADKLRRKHSLKKLPLDGLTRRSPVLDVVGAGRLAAGYR